MVRWIKHFVRMHTVLLIGCATALGADLNITVTGAGSGIVTVCPGAEVSYEVTGELTDANNEGLAGFVFDLSLDGEPLPPAETPTGDPMIRFAIPNGFTNPAGYGGTVAADCLVQVGGAQNTVNNPGPDPPYPTGDVMTGVAHTAVELVTGSLTAPIVPGTYTLSVSSVVAAVIKQDETGVPFWATEVAGTGTITNLTIVVGFASSPPEAEMIEDAQKQLHVSTKNRFLSFTAGDAGESQAIRVTFVDLPPPYDQFNGNTMWVGEPWDATEIAGSTDTTPPTFKAAKLQCEPYFPTDWSSLGTIHVFSAYIVPGATYWIQVVNQACDLADESGYSEALELNTSKWGDVCAGLPLNNQGQWGPPDGVASLSSDVIAIQKKVLNKPGLTKARADLGPGLTPPSNYEPDMLIRVSHDVVWAVQAYLAQPYPFPPPQPWPCP